MEIGGIQYVMRQCLSPECRFRFPADEESQRAVRCPYCGANTEAEPIAQKPFIHNEQTAHPTPTRHLELLLDNIRSLYNVGSIFRTADGANVHHLHLGGITATPEHPKLAKTALGAHTQMGWTYYRNGWETAVSLKQKGYTIWALEDTPTAQSIYTLPQPLPTAPVLLVVGNENVGVDPAILAIADAILSLPMLGAKDSLNVAVATGIAIYQLMFGSNYDHHST